MAEGRLLYVIGPSGSGKDSLLRYAREKLAGDPCVVFAHRYITRPFDAGGENHIALTDEEFDARVAGGLFAMHWASHGCRYGIGREINLWLAKGCSVVMNGSRAYLAHARQHYPELVPVSIEVSREMLESRLRARGREGEAEIAERLARAAAYMPPPDAVIIRNDGSLEDAGTRLTQLIVPGEAASCA